MPRRRREPPEAVPGVSVPVPAPGALEIVQAFVNTAPSIGRAETLASPAALCRWFARRGLLAAGTEPSEPDLTLTLEVRAALRAVLAARDRGELDAGAATRLEQSAGELGCGLSFDDGGPDGFCPAGASAADSDPAGPGAGEALGVILANFVVARATVYWPHFRLCASAGCRQAFYDASRSRTGRWCTKRCGNRARAATYRRSREGR